MHRVFIALAHLLAVSMLLVHLYKPRFIPRSAKLTPRCQSIVSKTAKNYVEDLLLGLHGLQPGSNLK